MGSSADKGRHLAISTRPPRPLLGMVEPCHSFMPQVQGINQARPAPSGQKKPNSKRK